MFRVPNVGLAPKIRQKPLPYRYLPIYNALLMTVIVINIV